MENSLYKFWRIIFVNFMYVYLADGILNLFGYDFMGYQLIMLSCFLYGITQIRYIQNWNTLDTLVVIYVTYILLNSILIDYPHHWLFWYNSFIFHCIPIACYFIARTGYTDLTELIERMKWPMAIAMIGGIIFFFTTPGWYLAIKYTQLDGSSDMEHYYSIFRLSSFWVTPYVIGYSTFIYSAYLVYKLFILEVQNLERKISWCLLVIGCVVLMLAQMRAAIAGFVLCFGYIFLTADSGYSRGKMMSFMLIAILCIGYMLTQDAEHFSYILDHLQQAMNTGDVSERLEGTGGDIDLFTFFGNGYGRYIMKAREYGGFAIIDSEYQKHLAELGILGFSILILILATTFFKSIFNKNMRMEFCILMFYMIAFIGASALSAGTEFPFIFWFSVGSISSKIAYYRGGGNFMDFS